MLNGRSYCHCGRWYSHIVIDVEWQMLMQSVADGMTTIVCATCMADVIAWVA